MSDVPKSLYKYALTISTVAYDNIAKSHIRVKGTSTTRATVDFIGPHSGIRLAQANYERARIYAHTDTHPELFNRLWNMSSDRGSEHMRLFGMTKRGGPISARG